MKDLRVVIVTWNTRALVLDCLESVTAALAPGPEGAGISADICVVDNGSADGTAAAIHDRFPDVELITLPANRGFAAGCNRGLRGPGGRHVLLLNSDARPRPGAIEACIGLLDRHPDIGIVGPQLLHADGRLQNSIHNFPTVVSEGLPRALLQFVRRRRFPSKRWIGDEPVDVEAVTGAAVFARAEMICDVGPLPEDYFFYLEDTEWCRRAGAAGWRVVHHPKAFVTHLSGASSKRRSPTRTRIEYHRSLYHFFRVNRGVGRMAMVMSMRLFKCLLYVVTQAPFALGGGSWRRRWKTHRDVLVWHVRGCPRSAGLSGGGALPSTR